MPASTRWSSPTRARAPMLTDIMGGQIHLIADPMASSLPLAAVRQDQGARGDEPEARRGRAGHPDRRGVRHEGLRFGSWYGLWGPKGLPADIAAKLQAEVAKAVAQPDIRQKLGQLGFEPIGSSTAEFAKYIDEEFRQIRPDHPRREDQGGVSRHSGSCPRAVWSSGPACGAALGCAVRKHPRMIRRNDDADRSCALKRGTVPSSIASSRWPSVSIA